MGGIRSTSGIVEVVTVASDVPCDRSSSVTLATSFTVIGLFTVIDLTVLRIRSSRVARVYDSSIMEADNADFRASFLNATVGLLLVFVFRCIFKSRLAFNSVIFYVQEGFAHGF